MLLHQTLDLQKRGQQIPFVLRSVDRVGQRFISVEGLQKRIKWIAVTVWVLRLRNLLCLLCVGSMVFYAVSWVFGIRRLLGLLGLSGALPSCGF